VSETYDVIVVGLGAMGSATAYHLARRGCRILGLDQYPPGHTFGSSHGESRIIRELYYEHPLYVPMVKRAYELWTELEAESGVALLFTNGGLMLGVPSGRIVTGSRESAILHGIPYEDLDADEIHRRFHAFRPPERFVGIWDARAGYLRADRVIHAHLELAQRHGAELVFGETVVSWDADGQGVTVATPTRRYRGGRLVLAAGPWMARIVADLALPLMAERQAVAWFDPPASIDDFAPDRFPIYICEDELGRAVYGFPRLETGVKAAIYHEGEMVSDPADAGRAVDLQEVRALQEALAPVIPALARAHRHARHAVHHRFPSGAPSGTPV
jgi:sarcosine oxidase